MNKGRIQFNLWNRPLKNPCGFTLIEMVAAIVLLGVIGIFSTQFITGITQSAQLTTAQKGLVDDAKLALEYIIRELRVASEENSDINISSSPTTVSITFDKFTGYTVDTNATSIVYAWDNTSKALTRTSGATTTTLATQVTNFTASEFPATGSNFYVFAMTLQGPDGENFILESGVRPRSTTA
jgi:MSHA biogenesis protein MshO